MINKKQVDKEQAMYAIQNGEFDKSILNSKSKVVVIMSQDWCPQWRDVKSWVYEIQSNEDIDIYELEYNKVDYFEDFMNFKEDHWRNYNVPYLRFYKDGSLIRDTNYLDIQRFKDILEINN